MKSIKTHRENSSASKAMCPLCESGNSVLQCNVGKYQIFSCRDCRGEFSWPMKSMDYSQVNETPEITNFEAVKEKSLRRNFNYAALITFLSQIPKGNILDIGSGTGIFVSHVKKLGFDCYCTDVSENIVKTLGDTTAFCKFSKFNGEDFHFPNEWPKQFDVISMVDVLEHVEKPLKIGRNIYESLKDGGYFIGSVPNRDRYYYALGGLIDDFVPKGCGGDNPPYHLTFWREKTVIEFLRKIGFENHYTHKGGLLWRKNIYVKEHYSPFLSKIVKYLYENSSGKSIMTRLLEKYGSHLIFISKKSNEGINIKDLESKIYKKDIPFFVNGDIE